MTEDSETTILGRASHLIFKNQGDEVTCAKSSLKAASRPHASSPVLCFYLPHRLRNALVQQEHSLLCLE